MINVQVLKFVDYLHFTAGVKRSLELFNIIAKAIQIYTAIYYWF